MKKVFKKNQVIITGLALLIAVAGYLNFANVDLGFDKDQEASSDNSILEEVENLDYDIGDSTVMEENAKSTAAQDEETAGEEAVDSTEVADATEVTDAVDETGSMDTETPGEAVLTGASNFAAQAKITREQVRAQNKEDLQKIIDNEQISETEKQQAIDSLVAMTELAEKETAAEMLLEAKGFVDAIVNLTGETADVVVSNSQLGDDQKAQIEDIVQRKTGVGAEQIVITSSNVDAESSEDTQTEESSQTEESTQTEDTAQSEEQQE